MQRIARIATAVAAVSALALGGLAPVGASGEAPGDPSMVNFEHVYNFTLPTNDDYPNAKAIDQGTDIEFYTSDVPERDGNGAIVLDANGDPVTERRDFAVVGSYYRGAFIFDITDPENTEYVTVVACNQAQNDVQIKKFGDRWILALASDDFGPSICQYSLSNGGLALFDITDPYAVTPAGYVRVVNGAHNFTFHPTQPYGWVSTGDIPGGRNFLPIIDFTNLSAPAVLMPMMRSAGSPHDISFNADGSRAYVAAEHHIEVYDATNPAAPTLLGASVAPASYVHGADPSPDGETLVVTDESLALGGFFAAGTTVCPGGGITFYDIGGVNDTALTPLGYFTVDLSGHGPDHRACTAHVGRFAAGADLYITGWYIGGVRVVDYSNPSAPVEAGHAVMPNTEVWSAKVHKGDYVYTSDLGRGFDVYRWTGPTFGNPAVGS